MFQFHAVVAPRQSGHADSHRLLSIHCPQASSVSPYGPRQSSYQQLVVLLGRHLACHRRAVNDDLRTSTNIVGGAADQPSPHKRHKRAGPKRRRAGSGSRPPGKRRLNGNFGKCRAPAKRSGQKGERKRRYKKRGGGAKRVCVRMSTPPSAVERFPDLQALNY